MTVDTLGRVSCVSKYKDITFKDHKSITKKEGKKTVFEKKKKIEKDQGKEGAAIKIMYLFLKLTIHTVLVN